MCYCFLSPMEILNVDQSECKCRVNFNTMELEVLVDEVITHSVKQRNEQNNR